MSPHLLAVGLVLGGILIFTLLQGGLRLRAGRRLARLRFETAGAARLVYFTSASCSACARQRAELRRLEGVAVTTVDVDVDPATAATFGVVGLPATAVIGADGRPVRVFRGFTPAAELSRVLFGVRGLASAGSR